MGIFKMMRPTSGQDELLSLMVRVLSEYETGYLEELLQLLKPLYGEGCVLSVVSSGEREVIASTDTHISEVEHMAKSISRMDKKGYFLRNEHNGVRFRKKLHCVRVVPLVYRKNSAYALLVEQVIPKAVTADRLMNVLALAVMTRVQERLIAEMSFQDAVTGLPTKDKLVRVIEGAKGADYCCIGMLWLERSDLLGNEQDIASFGKVVCHTASMLQQKYGKDKVFCVGENRFAVLKEGNSYQCVAALQDVMESLSEEIDITVKGAVSYISDDVSKALYLCEKACAKCDVDVVVFVRDRDIDVNTVEETFYKDKSKGKEEESVENIVYEDVTAETKETEKQTDSVVEEAKQDLAFFFNSIPDNDDIIDDI